MDVDQSVPEKVTKKIQFWIKQLRDVGHRNRLLFFKNTKSSTIEIIFPNVFDFFENLVVRNKRFFSPLPNINPDLDNWQENQHNGEEYSPKQDEFLAKKDIQSLNNTLRNLMFRSRTVREEQGINTLFIAFGILKWKEYAGSEFSEAPLLLLPLDIDRVDSDPRFSIKLLEEELIENSTLKLKLESDFNITLVDIPTEISVETLQNFWEETRVAISRFDDWKVEPRVIIGLFNFQTLMLINDLEMNQEEYIKHPIIKLLSGIELEEELFQKPIIIAEEMDEKVNPVDVFQILDADSSQQEAIEAAKSGMSFILQGPPGTGKSQTIANIIAESIASGKKVLFVSQKSVALDVVFKRLEKCGLGDFCLKIHSYKKSKKEIIAELGNSLYIRNGNEVRDHTAEKRELFENRMKINNYVYELHKKHFALDKSLFEAYGEIAKFHDYPSIDFFIPNITDIDLNMFRKYLDTIHRITSFNTVIKNHDSHLWRGYTESKVNLQTREELKKSFNIERQKIEELLSSTSILIHDLNIICPISLNQYCGLFKILSLYKPDIFSSNNEELLSRLKEKYNSFFRIMNPNYWKDRSNINQLKITDDKNKFEELIDHVNMVIEIRDFAFNAPATPNLNIPINKESISKINKLISDIYSLLELIRKYFGDITVQPILRDGDSIDIRIFDEWLRMHSEGINTIVEWVDYSNAIRDAKELGLGGFIEEALGGKIPSEKWVGSFKRRFNLLFADQIIDNNDVFFNLASTSIDNSIDRFKQLDLQLINNASHEIREKLFNSRPISSWVNADSAETSILKKELNKKRRIKPLRILFQEIPELILNLKPCLMMSPLTVSQLLDPNIFKFDIAIFDEASQIPPEYAVGTILRSKQIIIAGDRKQLPPTSFFQSITSDLYDEDDYDIEEYESILDACDSVRLPNKMLLWHYRSLDESLIVFSNYHFYDNRLLTFPNADKKNTKSGLEYIYIKEGVYRRGKGARNNPIEARAVANLVISILRDTPELSIGIVTFSQSQREIVELELERVKRENSDLAPLFSYQNDEELFIKNLETIQGDERDIIIFSIGYGKDETGLLSMNFGPLNKQGGERRLNVAITRARLSVKIVTSIEPEDLDLRKSKSRGVKLLRTYLQIARDGVGALHSQTEYYPTAEFDSPFEEAVYERLTKEGLILHKQIGVSNYRIDFGVVDPKQPGRYLLGIECDGATYHSSPTARDRDRLRQQILEEKFGWKIHRIWSRDWINDPQKEVSKVLQATENNQVKKK